MTRSLALITALFVFSAASGRAQVSPVGRHTLVYGGVGAGEGVGLVVLGASSAFDVFSRDVAVLVAYRPGTDGSDGRLSTAFGVGGGIRLLRLVSVARSRSIPTGDIDVGLRIGPSFSVGLGEQTDAQRGRAFAVFADPFVRVSRSVRGRAAFAELGAQAPNVRVGLSARLGR